MTAAISTHSLLREPGGVRHAAGVSRLKEVLAVWGDRVMHLPEPEGEEKGTPTEADAVIPGKRLHPATRIQRGQRQLPAPISGGLEPRQHG